MTLKKRIFITGGSGFLGWNLIRRIAGKYELYCTLPDSPLPDNGSIQQFTVDFNGLLHLGGLQRCSRYEFGREFARQGGYDPDRIRGMLLTKANAFFYRPPDVSLDSSPAKKVFDLKPFDIQKGIARYFREVPG
jgi:dTDP-4-dehydrorhamnose reductase